MFRRGSIPIASYAGRFLLPHPDALSGPIQYRWTPRRPVLHVPTCRYFGRFGNSWAVGVGPVV